MGKSHPRDPHNPLFSRFNPSLAAEGRRGDRRRQPFNHSTRRSQLSA